MMLHCALTILFLGALASAQEIKSTDFNCANSMVRLECEKDMAIFVSRLVHKYSPTQCVEHDANMNLVHKFKPLPPLDHCLGIDYHDERVLKECNGKESCNVQIEKKSHLIGFYGTNCDFQSNIAKIFYTCVPNTLRSSIKSFDICEKNGPEVIMGLNSGFIHSPNFPSYYGNNRFCVVNIGVPQGQRLVLFLVSLSLEGLSILDGKANDYLLVDNDKELYGKLDMPYILYNASDRESVQLKFKTDWITTTRLTSPKGFLIYFELSDAVLTTTTVAPTTTEPVAITEPLIIDSNRTNSMEDADSFDFEAAHIKRNDHLDLLRERQGDNMVTIVSVLVGLIGVLILIIFGLLLLFRSKQKQTNEDDQIYDTVSDEKSMSNIYGGSEYNASNSFNSTTGGDSLNKSIDEDKQKLKGTLTRKQANESKFNLRLKKFYSNIGQTLSLSSKILADAHKSGVKDERLNNSCVKSNESMSDEKKDTAGLDESSSSKTNLKMFSINEFNPNDCDIKYEKDIAIDTLKLCKTPSTNNTLRKAISLYKNNLEHQHHQQRANMAAMDQEALNRSENVYVSNPVESSALAPGDNVASDVDGDQKLQIYEVNFDNNYAYITPAIGASTTTASTPATPTDTSNKSAKSMIESAAEIYQTINEIDDDDQEEDDDDDDDSGRIVREVKSSYRSGKQNVQDSIEDLSIYQTPCNKRILSSTLQGSAVVMSDALDERVSNHSVVHLLNENNDETVA